MCKHQFYYVINHEFDDVGGNMNMDATMTSKKDIITFALIGLIAISRFGH